MSAITILLLMKAFERSGTEISFVASNRSWTECVTYEELMDAYYLWYNTPDNSTHVVILKSDKIEE